MKHVSSSIWKSAGTILIGLVLSLPALTAPALARDVLHRSNPSEPDTLDAQKASIVPDQTVIGDLYQGLIGINEKGDLIPAAAERWEVSADGLTYTYHLRDGLLWSDGHPVTAMDYEAAYKRLYNPKTASRPATFVYMVKNGEAVNLGKLPLEELGVRATNDKTLVVELEYPSPMFARVSTAVWFYPIPRHIAEAHGEVWFKDKTFVGNGPFMLDEWSPNEKIVLKKTQSSFLLTTSNLKVSSTIQLRIQKPP